jgi:hypothetical protein
MDALCICDPKPRVGPAQFIPTCLRRTSSTNLPHYNGPDSLPFQGLSGGKEEVYSILRGDEQ